MKHTHTLKLIAALALGAFVASPAHAVKHPEDLIGPEKCLECHKSEAKAWQKTHHFNTFIEMHKSAKAKEIATTFMNDISRRDWSFASSRRCINPWASLNATPAPHRCLQG